MHHLPVPCGGNAESALLRCGQRPGEKDQFGPALQPPHRHVDARFIHPMNFQDVSALRLDVLFFRQLA